MNEPVVSRNSISGKFGPSIGLELQESEMDVSKLVMVSLAGWVNQQQENVIVGSVEYRERLGGMLRYGYREAA